MLPSGVTRVKLILFMMFKFNASMGQTASGVMQSDAADASRPSSGEPAGSEFGERLPSVDTNEASWNSMIVSSLAMNWDAVRTLAYLWERGVMSHIF